MASFALLSRRARNHELGSAGRQLSPTLNPIRLWRRRRRLHREALAEALFLRRRHGEHALEAARSGLERPELTRWGRAVLQKAMELLRTRV